MPWASDITAFVLGGTDMGVRGTGRPIPQGKGAEKHHVPHAAARSGILRRDQPGQHRGEAGKAGEGGACWLKECVSTRQAARKLNPTGQTVGKPCWKARAGPHASTLKASWALVQASIFPCDLWAVRRLPPLLPTPHAEWGGCCFSR